MAVQWLDTASDMEEHDKETHNFCADCNRYFSSVNALKNVSPGCYVSKPVID